jgi:hypothetical protein
MSHTLPVKLRTVVKFKFPVTGVVGFNCSALLSALASRIQRLFLLYISTHIKK